MGQRAKKGRERSREKSGSGMIRGTKRRILRKENSRTERKRRPGTGTTEGAGETVAAM